VIVCAALLSAMRRFELPARSLRAISRELRAAPFALTVCRAEPDAGFAVSEERCRRSVMFALSPRASERQRARYARRAKRMKEKKAQMFAGRSAR